MGYDDLKPSANTSDADAERQPRLPRGEFIYFRHKAGVPATYPLGKLRAVIDVLAATMNTDSR